MARKNSINKMLGLLTLFAFMLSFNVLAQNIDVITYGDTTNSPVVQMPVNSENIYVTQYSSDYLFSLGATKKNPAVCICSTSYDKIFITNNAPYESTFSIISNLPEYVSIPYSTMRLAAGKTAEIPIMISATCDESIQSLDYNILVSNNFGTQYTLERKLLITRCQSIEAILYSTANNIKPCEQVNYTIELKNSAPFTEEYAITPRSSSYFETKQYAVTLLSGQKTFLNFTYNPDCGVYGEKEMSFLIESVNNKLSAKVNHVLNIERAYYFAVSAPVDANMCRNSESQIFISIKNLAAVSNEFYFEIINKQDFITSNENVVTLLPLEEKTFKINLNPTSSTKTDQELDFTIKTNLGDLAYRGKINLKAYDCYALGANIIAQSNPNLCAGTYTYDVEIENKGLFKQNISLSDDSEFAEIFPSKIEVNPSEKKIVSLLISLPDQDSNNLPINMIASIDGQDVSAQDSLSIDVLKKNKCTLLSFEKQKLYARYGTKNITFLVKNVGTLETTYDLSYAGSSWINLQEEKINLKPGEDKILQLNLYSDNSDVQTKYNFKITANASNGEVYEQEMILKMTSVPLIQRIYNLITSTICTTVSTILLGLLILGIIATIILAGKRVRIPLTVKIIALALIVIIMVGTLLIVGLPKSRYTPIDKTLINNSNLIWYQDHSYNVDLNNYFFDPDQDELTFSLENEPENISVKIVDSNAKLTPDKGWFGNSRIRFSAKDNYGGEIESQRINLEVISVKEFSASACYARNCTFINAVLLILLLALVFTLRTRKENAQMSKKIFIAGIRKQKGFLYFVDKDGDVARVPMARNNKKNQKFKKEKVGKTLAIKKRK
ncbi:MAG: hypothetical protein WC758_05655 [Candidatus Woesearchaeota archaeon]|jgi:uncharacterized membrane protein